MNCSSVAFPLWSDFLEAEIGVCAVDFKRGPALLTSLWCFPKPWDKCHFVTQGHSFLHAPKPGLGGTASFTFHFMVTAAKMKEVFKGICSIQVAFFKFCRRGWFQDATLGPCELEGEVVFPFLEITGCWLRTSSRKLELNTCFMQV